MNVFKKILPEVLIEKLRPPYHYFLAIIGALIYRFPSQNIKVVAVTGTKGKSTVTELVNAILEEAEFKTSLANTLRFKIGESSKRNLYKMTMPGRFFLQRFLRKSVKENCDWAVIEMTSEGVKQFRHKFIDLDSLIWTNLSPEHIESHGSYENYRKAKIKIAKSLSRSNKKNRMLIINNDDKEAGKFKEVKNTKQIFYSIKDAGDLELADSGSNFKWKGLNIKTELIGEFNVYNILSALTFAKTFDIDLEKTSQAIRKLNKIKGRAEKIGGPGFDVYVDYAHTPDSLEKFYQAISGKKICVLGNTGGGRDKWKRPKMGRIADKYCEKIILTNEDPYDENPRKIIDEMAVPISKDKLKIILDRREAIRTALVEGVRQTQNQNNYVVLITGKGTDPYIMGPKGSKIPWDDAEIVREELDKKKRLEG
jgi:UDP-N-acetylmuramoyl-L-alanyl-D-glutamate--2,6-diaminopimelate ligase